MPGTLKKVRHKVASSVDADRRSELGQFMSPSTVARFMASLFPEPGLDVCRLLDPGAGMGSLTSAFLDRWEENGFGFRQVSAYAFEIDEILLGHLENKE